MQRRSYDVGTKIGVGFGLSLLMLLLVGGISRHNSTSLLETARWVAHTQEVLGQVARLTSRLREAESAVRGFALSGDPALLARHETARSELQQQLHQFRTLTMDNRDQQERVTALEMLIERKLRFHDALEKARRDQGLEAAAHLAASGEGWMAMEAILNTTTRIEKDERDLLARRDREAEESVRAATILIVVAMLAAMLLVAAVGVFIARDIGKSVRQREQLLTALREAIQHLGSASAELLATTAQQGTGAAEQAAAIAETATTAEEIAQTATEAAARIQTVAQISQRAVEVAINGKRAVDDTVGRIADLKERVQAMAESISVLAQRAGDIGELNASVGDIAEVSNILALNAAIEAARAGEHGRGFAVVAEEVRALAQQSKQATGKVRRLLVDMEGETARAARITDEGTRGAQAAVTSARESGEMFGELSRAVTASAQAAQQVAASATQQAAGVMQIQQAMRDIEQVTTQSLASTRQIETASNDLNHLSVRLRDMINGDSKAAGSGPKRAG